MTATEAPTAARLLAGYHALGRAATLDEHLDGYGPAPLIGDAPLPGIGPRTPSRAEARERLIRLVESAGLTGRQETTPTGCELRAVASSGQDAVIVVDAVEPEPTSGKDRLLLAVAPHLVLDGAALAAYAAGAREIVVRAGEIPAAVEHALAERSIITDVPVHVRRVPRGLEGGDPTRGEPALVADAETFAHIPLIARFGPEWFRARGTAGKPGTALFTVSGSVVRPGVVEAHADISVGGLLRLAGGPSEPVQAILAGGFGGTWLPPALLDAPAPTLEAAGATLGPGVVVALPTRACGLAESARILAWLAAEGSGHCDRCRYGLPAIAGDFARIATGPADPQAHRRLREGLAALTGRNGCDHAGGPVRFARSTLRVFEHHLGAHEKGCPAARRPGVLPVPAPARTM